VEGTDGGREGAPCGGGGGSTGETLVARALKKNYIIGFIFKRTFQWYNFYIKYLIFS
jgi:hypothetical protein